MIISHHFVVVLQLLFAHFVSLCGPTLWLFCCFMVTWHHFMLFFVLLRVCFVSQFGLLHHFVVALYTIGFERLFCPEYCFECSTV